MRDYTLSGLDAEVLAPGVLWRCGGDVGDLADHFPPRRKVGAGCRVYDSAALRALVVEPLPEEEVAELAAELVVIALLRVVDEIDRAGHAHRGYDEEPDTVPEVLVGRLRDGGGTEAVSVDPEPIIASLVALASDCGVRALTDAALAELGRIRPLVSERVIGTASRTRAFAEAIGLAVPGVDY